MPQAHSIQGLIKWVERAEWEKTFTNVLESHLLPACGEMATDPSEVVAILGEESFMRSVWGCGFEDFVTRRLDHGGTVIDDYLKRRGWKESASTRAYMQALRDSTMSLYEVSDIVVDKSFRARDLVRGGEPVLITERSATRSLKAWDRVAMRVLALGPVAVISGVILGFEGLAAERLLKLLRRQTKRRRSNARHGGDTPSSRPPALATETDDALRAAAPTITTIWLVDVIARATRQRVPELRNSEGDEIFFCNLHFPFAPGITASEIRRQLNNCPELTQRRETSWSWLQPGVPAAGSKRPNSADQLTLSTYSSEQSLVLGSVELGDDMVVLSVNSRERCERGRALLTGILGRSVGNALVEMETLEQFMEKKVTPAPKPDLSPDERRRIIHESMDTHYREVLDQAVPALGNMSPRAAVKTARGRARVVEWLKYMENQTLKYAGSNDAMATYDFGWLWTELGVDQFRR
jgi:hypothetical protein